MFKTASRYLSGVSVFLGDDITTRSSNGELAVFLGQATKGPRVPVELSSVDSAVNVFGADNPLVKAIYEFYDGFSDAGQKTKIKFVGLRVGGIPAKLTTSHGTEIETIDAYNGIEDDFFIYENNTPSNPGLKIWDKNKRLVYSSYTNLDAGYFTVDAIPAGDGDINSIYGIDIDSDPLDTPVSMKALRDKDVLATAYTSAGSILTSATTITVSEVIADLPLSGRLEVKETTGAITTVAYVDYVNTATEVTAKQFKLTDAIGSAFTTNCTVKLIGSTLVKGDSELDLTNRELYEKMRNALLDIEMYTPDYIIPGGCAYNAVDTYTASITETSLLKGNTAPADSTVLVDAAANWGDTGVVDIYDGSVHNYMNFTANAASGSDYSITVAKPSLTVTNIGPTSGANAYKTVTFTGDGSVLLASGFVKIGTGTYEFSAVDNVAKTITLTTQAASGDRAAGTLQKVLGTINISTTPSTVSCTYSKVTKRELGLGYVKEVDAGDKFTFTWSDTKLADYYLAHFGYLFANFCNNATVGYNTPLCGMNVDISDLEAAKFSRASIKDWIGTLPVYKYNLTNANKIDAVTAQGTGLLGEATLAGSPNFNRAYMSSATDTLPADPAYGLLMTDEGFVDGHEVIDTYNKPVDLGKFMLVGAALLRFGNKASNSGYIDSCGIYALGQLAGKAKNEGLSFSKIGGASNTDVTVIVTRSLYNDLAAAGYIVVTREKGLGWVINNANSCARNNSGYFLISTTRTIKYVIEGKRSVLVGFIGKPVSKLLYEAAKTRLAESFTQDVAQGLLANNAIWDLEIVQTALAIGKFNLSCKLDPALELTQVDIDAVIERAAA